MSLANATEGAARSTLLKVTQVEPRHVFGKRSLMVMCPSHRTTQLSRHNTYLATPERCKELEERFTAWSLKVAEHEHQFKAIDAALKTFVVMEMMPKDIKRGFLTGPRKFDEIMEKLEIIVNEMMAVQKKGAKLHGWAQG